MVDFGAALQAEPLENPPAKAAMDIETVRLELRPYDAEIEKMLIQAEALEVEDSANLTVAVGLAAAAKKLDKAIENIRKDSVKPFNDHVKQINGLARGFQDRLKKAASVLTGKINQFQAKERARIKEAEERAKAAAKKAGGGDDVIVVVPEAPTVTRTEQGSAHQRGVWKWEIDDEAQIPREYLTLDTKKINGAVKAGIRNIPGLNIFEETQTVIRT